MFGEEPLTSREWEALLARVKGESFAEIGRTHGVGAERASQIVKEACKALGARDTGHALAICLAVGIFDIREIGDMVIPDFVRAARDEAAPGPVQL